MIVLDASALVELARATPLGQRITLCIADLELGLHVPHLADLEVTQALRRYEQTGALGAAEAAEALASYRQLDLERHVHEPLLERVWQLRRNLTAYDAAYIALAEALASPLLTCDRKMARAPGHRAEIQYLGD